MNWNREIASLVITCLMLLTFILLIIYRKKLGKKIIYFILAIGLGTFIEIMISVGWWFFHVSNTVTVYVIGTNLGVFLLFFIYFHSILEVKTLRVISSIFIGLFLLEYVLSAIFIESFFTHFPFFSYLIQVVLLSGSIYLVISQTFNSEIILNLSGYYPIWICVGLMEIYLGVMPLLIMSNTSQKMMNANMFFIILFLVNVIGYSILITGIFFASAKFGLKK